jgi:predicted aldo/keto reductase-like oxidoreductase
MNTDVIDLWQVHSVRDPDDVDNRIANEIFEVFIRARDEGKVRHIGFTGHTNPEAHLRVLERTEESRIFETIQMPINVVDANHNHFINSVLPVAAERNLGILAMKTMADGRFFASKQTLDREVWSTERPIIPDILSVREALFFVWSLPVSVLITGAENADYMRQKIDLAREFSTLGKADRQKLIAAVSDPAAEGKVEYYKKI